MIPVPKPVTEDTTATTMPKPATPADPVQIVTPSNATAPGSLVQTIFALGLVLALIAMLAWVLKRLGPRAQPGAGNLHIVGALNLGGRERIIVVEIGGQWIVVGASPGRVNALATMPRQEGLATLEPHAPPMPNFAQWLKQTIDKRNAKKEQ